MNRGTHYSVLPSVDRVLGYAAMQPMIAVHGRVAVRDSVRAALVHVRARLANGTAAWVPDEAWFADQCGRALDQASRGSPRPVLNLTGIVLHTNLGRALLPEQAIEAVAAIARSACDLEFRLAEGERGDRDAHVRQLICELTGAEDTTIVNNNAAAVLLALNTLALGREVLVSRGELIEIGGSFRMPEIMERASCRLREVGTTNRTHVMDYASAVGPDTALLLKVHTSNYRIRGFTSTPSESDLAALAAQHGVPFMVDLGSGSLVDLGRYGLPHEPTPMESIKAGADLVTFSGDKLLGGPQAGVIVGRSELIQRLKRNPLKRALRVDKLTLAALRAVLVLFRDPERLVGELPTLRHLTRPPSEMESLGRQLLPLVAERLGGTAKVTLDRCASRIGSGALPEESLASYCLSLRPPNTDSATGSFPQAMAARLAGLPMPIIGRVHDGTLQLDLRCLDDAATLLRALQPLQSSGD